MRQDRFRFRHASRTGSFTDRQFPDVGIDDLISELAQVGDVALRLTVRQTLTANMLGEFSIQPQQTGVRAVFVNLEALQKAIAQEKRANLILLSETSAKNGGATADNQVIDRMLRSRTSLEDFGIKLRIVSDPSEPPLAVGGEYAEKVTVASQSISLEHESRLISDSLAKTAAETADSLSLRSDRILSYLANNISSGDRSIPYSLVTALDQRSFEAMTKQGLTAAGLPVPMTAPLASPHDNQPPIILNEWAARDLGVRSL